MEYNFLKPLIAKAESTQTGFSAYAEDFPVFTTGRTLDELKLNLVEAFQLYFKSSAELEMISESKSISVEDIEVEFIQ